ncbi:hypothetical protein HPP92_012503 [Vanilla planifolia]|uniref:Erythronate-4-phosphate dehydrogenase family protein n=1 Tax=Vanilla planifolia TaxID=51239 RepID=A0A835QS90_VANPL|nr:hypothetical protein HPP92_012503 [Vanilla planifolia]
MAPPSAPPETTKMTPALYRLLNPGSAAPSRSSWFEIRLFYVRISPCAPGAVPPWLVLCHLRRERASALEINGSRIPVSDPTSIPLRRDRVDCGVGEVTYVSTDGVRLAGAVDFEVSDGNGNLILCGSLERVEAPWSNGAIGFKSHQGTSSDKDPGTGWSMDCYSAASMTSSIFLQPKLGVSSPSIEVYVAGCYAGFPLILTQTILLNPRKKAVRPGALVAIPEDEETSETPKTCGEDLLYRRSLSSKTDHESDEYNLETKTVGHSFNSEGWFTEEDGQLSWFNAGVRVGMGIGLGMSVGIGIGLGLLMRSYQATTRNFKRRFF